MGVFVNGDSHDVQVDYQDEDDVQVDSQVAYDIQVDHHDEGDKQVDINQDRRHAPLNGSHGNECHKDGIHHVGNGVAE